MSDTSKEKTGKPYKQILKSTFLMGGSSIIVTIMGIVRTKILALVLGPTGVGLAGVYMNVTTLVRTFSGMGIGESGMRQIAGAVGTGNHDTIGRTALGVRRASLLSGIVGLLMLLALSGPLSSLTFGTASHAHELVILSSTILLSAVSLGQIALLQGMRSIGDLAKANIWGAVLGTVFSIPLIYLFKEESIVYVLITVAVTTIITSWWYCRKLDIPAAALPWRDTWQAARPLVKLGVALMLGALMAVAAQYILRVLVLRYQGLSAAGVYHAATTLSLVYVGVILNAMLTDFYPHISAAAHDHEECASLINKQAEVGLLLVVPGILAMMTLASPIIVLFYSSKFTEAVDVLRWQMLGGMLQAVTWPMGYMIRAQGDARLVFWTELYANGIHLLLAWLGIAFFGMTGIGMSYFGKDFFYLFLMYFILRRKYGFTFSGTTLQIFGVLTLATVATFVVPMLLPKEAEMAVNAAITLAGAIYALGILVCKTSSDSLPGFLFRLKTRFGF